MLLILYVGLIGVNVLGVPADEHLNIRISMVIAALWLGGFAIPVLKNPPLPKKVSTADDHETIIDSYKLLWRTVVTLKREAPHTLFFLIASAVFRDGLAGVFTFGAVLAKTAFGFSASDVMIFAIAANIVAGLATVAFGWVDDKIGPKNVIMLSLTAMVVAGFGVFLPARPRTHRVLEPRPGPVCFCWPHPVRVAFLPVAHPSPRVARARSSASTPRRAAPCPSWPPPCTASSS